MKDTQMSLIKLASFEEAALVNEPFEYCIVPNFIRQESMENIHVDYPRIQHGGSFPWESLECGQVFCELCQELQGTPLREAMQRKFDMDLTGRPTTLTVRGRCRPKDGKIHTDSKSKLITVLLYLNGPWESQGGRLRLLASPDSLDDFIAEVPPQQGTLVCFRNRPNAWHGHGRFDGVRRVLQLNWVTDDQAANRSHRRHWWSSFIKQCSSFRKAG